MKNPILHALRRVPKLGKSWKYVPLHELPEGTVMLIETVNSRTPGEQEPRPLNHSKEEYDVERLSEGLYRLQMGIGCSATLTQPNGLTEHVRCLTVALAPTGCLSVNVDRENELPEDYLETLTRDPGGPEEFVYTTTWRLVTGEIISIKFPEWNVTLHKNDGRKKFTRAPVRDRSGGRRRIPLRERLK